MAGSGARMTQKWQRKLLGWKGGGGEGLGLAGKLLLCIASENNIFFFFP